MRWIRFLCWIILAVLSTGEGKLDAHAAETQTGIAARFIPAKIGTLAPDVDFQNGMGDRVVLQDFAGKTILVNLWATWCPPCIKEMPSLNRLQQKLGGDNFAVVAVNQDRGNRDMVRNFYARMNLFDLMVYVDPLNRLGAAFNPPGLPVSVLIDPSGREIGRFYGDYEWDSPDAIAFLQPYLGIK